MEKVLITRKLSFTLRAIWSRRSRIIRLYGIFFIANVAYKCFELFKEHRRARLLWKHLPGLDTDFTARGLLEKKTFANWILSRAQDYPKESLIKTDFVVPMLLFNDAEGVKWMLKDEFDGITKSKGTDMVTQMISKFLGHDGIFVVRHGSTLPKENAIWEEMRKKIGIIFTRRNFNTMFHNIFQEKCSEALELLNKKEGDVLDMQELFLTMTMNAMEHAFTGQCNVSVADGMSSFGKNFDKTHHHLMSFALKNPLIEVLNRTLLPYPFGNLTAKSETINTLSMRLYGSFNTDWREFHNCKSLVEEYIYDKMEKAKKDPKKYDGLIAAFLKKGDLSDRRLKDVALSIMIAGRDTTASLLTWLFFELTQNPKVQQELVKEIDSVLNGKIPVLSDFDPSNMPVLNGCIYETLRLHPPAPVDVKCTSYNLEYNGTFIPKDTLLMYSPYAMGRNPTIYKSPESFNPSRWIPFKKPSAYEFPVFQAGLRYCIGKDLAQFEAKMITSIILQKFTFTMDPEDAKEIRMSQMLTGSVANNEELNSYNLWLKPHRR